MDGAGEITAMLDAAKRGDNAAFDRLFGLLYPDLRRIARARMRRADERVLLDTTSLVHECYLRLLRLERIRAQDRAHFLAYAARVMRSVVVDIAREQQALRRGGDRIFITFDSAAIGAAAAPEENLLLVHAALQELEELEPRLVRVVEMRYFVGLTNADIADALGVSSRTIERDWERARSFLFIALKRS